jgi:integrase/recombinase XerD
LPGLEDPKNIYIATCTAIEKLKPEQDSLRNDLKFAAIHFAKFLVANGFLNEDVLLKLKQIKITRIRDPKQPVIREKHLQLIIEGIKCSTRSALHKALDEILVLTLFFSAMRLSEVVNLKLCDVDLDGDRISIWHSKGGRSRVIAINKALKSTLVKYINNRNGLPSEQLFILPNGNPLTKDQLYRRITRLTKAIGLAGGCHQFRRGCVSYYADRGIPMPHLQLICGHKNLQSTLGYYKPDHQDILQKQVNW